MSYSVQNSITIKRVRSSDSLIMTFENNGIPLFQAIDDVSGAIAPNWEVAENQPVRMPTIVSTRGNVVNVILHTWSYNGTAIIFNGTEVGGWTLDSTGRFQINAEGHIKIVKNLASAINIANDVLSYTAKVSVLGAEYDISGNLEITIQKMGASSYYASSLAGTGTLSSTVQSTTITTKLYQGVTQITNYYTKWFKDFTEWPEKAGQKDIDVTRSDVGGAQLFICEFYKTSAVGEPVIARAGIRIMDISDEFNIVFDIISANKMVDKILGVDYNVTVKGKLVNMKTGSVIAPPDAVWRLDVINREDWTSLKTSNTDTIIVTPAETDRNDNFYDVDVMGEVEFS